MKRNFAVGTVVAMLLCTFLAGKAQFFSYPYVENFGQADEYLLTAPNPHEGTQVLPVGIDLWEGEDVNTIYYGMTPPGSQSKPVLVFVHGYASRASIWYEGDDNMYNDVYQDGYRSAFVSLTPNRHMWTNGNMLSNSIDQIKAYYGVNEVIVVAHSKGGVDTDAAIVHFGANSKVDQVFTLSSPHRGTSIAEVANSVLLSLVNIIFMQNNDATRCLQRGYMNYFRSLTDGAPGNTVPYTTLGGWGNGPLARLSIPQGMIHLIDGPKSNGGNDGVVPYASSRRPGGRELFSGQRKEYGWFGIPYYPGPSETELDHFEVTRGDLVWPFVKGVIEGTLKTAPGQEEVPFDQSVVSQMQVVTSAGGANSFSIHPSDEAVSLWMASSVSDKVPVLRSLDGGPAPKLTLASQSLPGQEGGVSFMPDQLIAGRYEIQLEGDWVALVQTEGPIQARLNPVYVNDQIVFSGEKEMEFDLEVDLPAGVDASALQVSGTVNRTLDLDMQARKDAPGVLQVCLDGNAWKLTAPADLPAGIYSVSVTVQGESFARNLVSSVALTGNKTAAEALNQLEVNAWPNPFDQELHVRVPESAAGELVVYNIFGQEVRRFGVVQAGQELVWKAKSEGAAPGVYFVEWSNGREKETLKVVLR